MRDERLIRILRPSLALVALAAALVLLGLAVAGPAHAGTESDAMPGTPTRSAGAIVLQRGAEVQFGEDILVPRGTTVPSVVAFGGDITVNGRVTDAVVAFGGDVVINGSVGTSTVAFGGDVRLGPRSVLGRALNPADASLVLFGGHLTQAPGAQVVGQTKIFDSIGWTNAVGWAAKGVLLNRVMGFSFFGWLVQTAFCLVLALVAAALMPRQLRSVQRHLGAAPWASLGWGALLCFIVLPAVLVVLVISIIGLLLLLPYGVFVLLAFFFVTTGAASFLAQKVITGFGGRENLMLAVTIGVVGTTIVSRIPVAGFLVQIALIVFGAGAAALGFAEWRRGKREEAAARTAAAAAAAAAPGTAAYATSAEAAPVQPTVITPIVQTSATLPAAAPAESTVATEVVAGPTVATEVAAPAEPAEPQGPEAPAEPRAPEAPVEPAAPGAAEAPPEGEGPGPAST